jgi:ABC-type sugar transport system ATPase subunit
MLGSLMCSARSNGAAVLWISHNVEEDSKIADRLFVIRAKTLIEEGAASC